MKFEKNETKSYKKKVVDFYGKLDDFSEKNKERILYSFYAVKRRDKE